MHRPRLLLLTNEGQIGAAEGQIDGYKLMVESGEIESCRSISFKESFNEISSFERVRKSLSSNDYDIIIVWSPGTFPTTEAQFEEIIDTISGRPILYWEGDPWGQEGEKKPVTKQMSWWMSHSEIVFSTAVEPHFSIFKTLGARTIQHIPHTYCHVKFRNEEKFPPNINFPEDSVDFSIIASNTAWIPGITGSPGALKRWELVTRVHFESQYSNRLYGGRWPKGWSQGLLKYEFQGREIRKSKVNLNWDNFDKYEDYASDRLPIALLAGRPHITTRHPGRNWLPNENVGLFQETSPKNVLNRGKELLSIDPMIRFQLGLEAHNWVKFRLSHREAARYIISSFYGHVKMPIMDPWQNLARLD